MPPSAEYCCPGQPYPISRAVHLGRLARFHADCRNCPHRDDTGTLSGRHVRRLHQTQSRGDPPSLLTEEAIVGVGSQIEPALVGRLAVALGSGLHRDVATAGDAPLVVVGGDGRPASAPRVAAAIEGLRWSGCHVVDAGTVSGPCLVHALDHLGATGGLLLGNPLGRSGTFGLKFWGSGGRLLCGTALADLHHRSAAKPNRPTRTSGALRRVAGDELYLTGLAEHFHALRPLCFVVQTTSPPVNRFLRRLTAHLACRVIERRPNDKNLSAEVVAERAHFGICITDDGGQCCIIDERGGTVDAQQLARLLARQHFPSPAELRVDGHGRLWFPGLAAPDALQLLSRLLVVLSGSDRKMSTLVAEE